MTVILHGEQVHGRYVLFKTGERRWLIRRLHPPDPIAARPKARRRGQATTAGIEPSIAKGNNDVPPTTPAS